jgi:hypothetical protein
MLKMGEPTLPCINPTRCGIKKATRCCGQCSQGKKLCQDKKCTYHKLAKKAAKQCRNCRVNAFQLSQPNYIQTPSVRCEHSLFSYTTYQRLTCNNTAPYKHTTKFRVSLRCKEHRAKCAKSRCRLSYGTDNYRGLCADCDEDSLWD